MHITKFDFWGKGCCRKCRSYQMNFTTAHGALANRAHAYIYRYLCSKSKIVFRTLYKLCHGAFFSLVSHCAEIVFTEAVVRRCSVKNGFLFHNRTLKFKFEIKVKK